MKKISEEHAKKAFSEYQAIRSKLMEYNFDGAIRTGNVNHMGKVGLTTPIALFMEKFLKGSIQIDIK